MLSAVSQHLEATIFFIYCNICYGNIFRSIVILTHQINQQQRFEEEIEYGKYNVLLSMSGNNRVQRMHKRLEYVEKQPEVANMQDLLNICYKGISE